MVGHTNLRSDIQLPVGSDGLMDEELVMQGDLQMSLTDLFALIGQQHVHIVVLQKQLAARDAAKSNGVATSAKTAAKV